MNSLILQTTRYLDLSFIVPCPVCKFMISDYNIKRKIPIRVIRTMILVFSLSFSCLFPASADVPADLNDSSVIILTFTGTDPYDIERVSLMKAGEMYQDGQSHQIQNTEYNYQSKELVWHPCNDLSCSVLSLPTSGGKTGRDELILEITLVHPGIDADSCYGDTTCERLQGKTRTISGMLEGYFKTGKKYEVSISSLKAGIGESFQVIEIVE